ncbi:2'-5' RNA ligase family protein [Verrucosispora sp. WMMC514]|uniref:2'-5' RNA ligase family protein n=1 Tax=Verrucosispora sp. WMMC514 TaxID=3015156 RepID=UPI00248AE1C8|nr:2'-5' RNA ligase family protein [Verrucosispora sp. WMMC514]WBB94197.1 2'-5' RNA ligase family protein [Verrucosispora sp. WMMC514]
MPATAELARRDGVELIRTGRWSILTGTWNATREQLASAVEATKCPAVRKPVLKIGHTDKRFASGGDGEPAIGWIEGLRLTDGGHTLVGDYVGVPAWLNSIMASAWPDRSVEGRPLRCQLGHHHPFVLTGVALLGVTPPGVGTLTSLNSLADVQALYGLAASTGDDDADLIVATVPGDALRAAAEEHTGAMIALIPADEDAERLAVEGGEPAGQLHVTLAYLGDAVDLSAADRQDIIDAVSSAVNGAPEVRAEGFGLGLFNPPGAANPDGKDRDSCTVLLMGGDDLDTIHTLVGDALTYAEVRTPQQHAPWHAHMTLLYTDDLDRFRALVDRVGPVRFDRLRIALAGQHIDIPLIPDEPEPADADDGLAVAAAAGGRNALKRYWTRGEGLKRWAGHKHPWTRLYRLLRKHVGSERAKRMASQWFRDVFGYWPGHRKGKNPVGPG